MRGVLKFLWEEKGAALNEHLWEKGEKSSALLKERQISSKQCSRASFKIEFATKQCRLSLKCFAC